MNIDDYCPVSEALNFFNRKWILCILMDIFRGKKHFSEFQEANPQLSNNTLSETLKYMEKVSLIKKVNVNEKTRNKTEYYLTQKGLKTNKIIYELSYFALKELDLNKLDPDFNKKIEKYYEETLHIDENHLIK
ncbi:MAG: helix-turn-helix transcriptional regulator [Methanosphaera stadtmanae]|nr:helix-turn-helix transcriptional regulator [Methanosphaera stadtmanae]